MNGYNFTDKAREVLRAAREESGAFNHEFIGTEHILLGLVREKDAGGAALLEGVGCRLDELRTKLESVLPRGTRPVAGEAPYTTRAKKTLELAMSAARELQHHSVGSGHLLLGLIREERGIAANILRDAGVSERAVLARIDPDGDRRSVAGISASCSGAPVRDAREMIQAYNLKPHPEGGHYREVYRSALRVSEGGRDRSAVTTIYYLLSEAEFSAWHVVKSDEVWHALDSTHAELLDFNPVTGEMKIVKLGRGFSDPLVHVVAAGNWQATRAVQGVCLMGCTVAPGFEFGDFALVRDLPGHEVLFAGALAPWRGML